MARPVVWTEPAVDDLEAAIEFIEKDSPSYAKTLAQLVVDAADSLLLLPNRGHRLRDPQLARFRELLVGAYRLIYLVEENRVLIVAVIHGHRRLRPVLRGRK